MSTWLIKTEPDDYSYADLARDKKTAWTGVRNPAAQAFMRRIAKGDEVLVYHTGAEKRIAGLAKVVRGAYEDPAHAGVRLASGEVKFSLFDLAPLRAAKAPENATLKLIKADARFEGYALVREPRLGVMPVPAKLDTLLRKMAGL